MGKSKTSARVARPASCVACGQAATGHHFNAPACDSCRIFFRRQVVTNYIADGCLKGGACARGESGRQCRACRFGRCIKGGMNPRMVHRTNDAESLEASGQMSTDLQLVPNPVRVETLVERMITGLLSIEDAHQRLRVSKYSPSLSPEMSLDSIVQGPSKLCKNFGIMCTMPYEPVSINLIPVEVMIKNRIFADFSNFDFTTRKLWITHDIIYAVEFIKAFPVYHLLDDSSKKVLLSSAYTCSNFTSAFYSYHHKSDRTFFPDGTLMTWNSGMIEQSPLSTRYHTAIIAAIKEASFLKDSRSKYITQSDLDVREYVLLKTIIICNPMLEGLTSHGAAMLSSERERCAKALLSYILSRRGAQQGPAFFTKMVAVINILIQLTSWMKSQHITALSLGLYNKPSPFFEAIFNSV